MAELIDYSVIAANNNSAPPDGWPEDQQYDTVNNCGREMMAVIKRDLDDRNGSNTTTGTAPTYELALSRSSITSLSDGLIVGFTCHAANSGAPTTLNVNSIGAASVTLPDGSDPVFVAGAVYIVIYDSANARFQLLSTTTPELALPSFTSESADRNLNAADVDGDYVNVAIATASPIQFTVPSGLASGGRIRFFNSVNSAGFDIRNGTGTAVIYRSDGGAAITNGNTATLTGVAYTLIIASSTRMYLLDY